MSATAVSGVVAVHIEELAVMPTTSSAAIPVLLRFLFPKRWRRETVLRIVKPAAFETRGSIS